MGEKIIFPALQIEQPIGTFYTAVMNAIDLVRVSYADIRTIETELDDYMGIQRKLSKPRTNEIAKYIYNVDATFPTSVILAIDDENIEWDEETKTLTLSSDGNTDITELAKIIDGQHRIEGLRDGLRSGDFSPNVNFQMPVSIFVEADLATQANIFATVNLAQTKVNRSLVYDLYSYEKTRSPQKTCHEIAVALDGLESSPLKGRIKRLGTATPGRKNEVLTQATVVESIMKLISTDPAKDRNTIIKKLFPKKSESDVSKGLIFRDLWLDGKDTDIAQIVINYFHAVKQRWPTAWLDLNRQGNVLPKTNGFKALMRFLKVIYPRILADNRSDRVPTIDAFSKYLREVSIEDNEFNIETFPPGTSGESRLSRILESSLPELQGSIFDIHN